MLNLIGTFREVHPSVTFEKINPWLIEPFGITRIADVTRLDFLDIHTCVAIRPNAKSLSNSQGKGLTKELAKTSAAMEAIELWHAENILPAPLHGSHDDLIKHHPLVSHKSAYGFLYHEHFPKMALDWQPVTNLINQERRFMPQVYFDLSHIAGSLKMLTAASSNGLASGNTLTEALCHALFEVIERDCFARFYQKKEEHGLRLIDLAHLPSKECETLVTNIIESNVQIRIYDMRSDLNIPAYYVALNDANHVRNLGLFGGYGCHFNDDVAMLRAITEAVQSRLTFISGARDDLEPVYYQKNAKPKPFLYQGKHKPNYQQNMPKSMEACLNQLLDCLYQKNHHEVYFYNHTRAPWNIPVVHVAVPSLLFSLEHKTITYRGNT